VQNSDQYGGFMKKLFLSVVSLLLSITLLSALAEAGGKQHAVSFGKWLPVKLFVGPTEDKAIPMKVRGLYVDGRLKEFTTGESYDVTDRMFVVRRSFRLNDQLPEDSNKVPHWKWQRGGWLLVDRSTGRVSQINLPDFDPFYSAAS
jgi:hypothetical protein